MSQAWHRMTQLLLVLGKLDETLVREAMAVVPRLLPTLIGLFTFRVFFFRPRLDDGNLRCVGTPIIGRTRM